MFPFPRGHGNGFPFPPLWSISADVHRRADESRLPCLAFTSTRIAQSGGVSTPRSAQHIASIHLRPTETGFSFLLQQRPTCQLQQALRYRGICIPAKVSSPPARPGPPARYTTSTVPPRLLLWLPGLLVLPLIRAALICPALAPWLDFIMPVLAFQSNKPG